MAKGMVAICVCLALGAAVFLINRSLSTGRPPSTESKRKVTSTETVVYSRANGVELSLDLQRPKKTLLRAAILLLHGGGWVSGSRMDMAELAARVADAGFLAASADYRLAPRSRWPAQLEDVQTAVRYLRANAARLNIDPENIAAVGISAGGQLSLFLGSVDAKHPQEYGGFSSRGAVVGSISGLHDLRLKMTPFGERYRIIEALTGSREGPAVAAASPILVTSKKSAPTYFVQGADDPLVPANQTEQAAKRLSSLGVPEHAVIVPGMGHGLTTRVKNQDEAFGRMLVWIYDHLPKRHSTS